MRRPLGRKSTRPVWLFFYILPRFRLGLLHCHRECSVCISAGANIELIGFSCLSILYYTVRLQTLWERKRGELLQ